MNAASESSECGTEGAMVTESRFLRSTALNRADKPGDVAAEIVDDGRGSASWDYVAEWGVVWAGV
jgi:hypothetical protein